MSEVPEQPAHEQSSGSTLRPVMTTHERIYAWVTMLVVSFAALWAIVNLVAIWPTVETKLLAQRSVFIGADSAISQAPPTAPPLSQSPAVTPPAPTPTPPSASVQPASSLPKTSNATIPLPKPVAKDSFVVRRHWIGGTDMWLFPMTFSTPITPDVRVLLLALLSGALGAAIHVFSSLSGYVGNRTFKLSWLMWYVLRMPSGALLGLFLTLALQGGLPIEQISFDGANPFQISFLAGLAGLFSRNALDKLEDVFETLFKTDRNDDRKDNMDRNDYTKVR